MKLSIKKNQRKFILDIVMTALLVFLMKLSFTGLQAHELLGVALLSLFGFHKILNHTTITQMFKNLKTLTKQSAVNFWLDWVILGFMGGVALSGVLISPTLALISGTDALMRWSAVHHFAAYCAFLLVSVHMGLHWGSISAGFKKFLRLPPLVFRSLGAFCAVLSVFLGVQAFAKRAVVQNFSDLQFVFHQALPAVANPELPDSAEKRNPKDRSAVLSPATEPETANIELTSITDTESETANIEPAATTDTEPEKPTLEEYLSKFRCDGCGKRCLLSRPQCGIGIRYQNQAIDQYNALYSAVLEGVETSALFPITSADAHDAELNAWDFIGMMGMVISGTYLLCNAKIHYSRTVSQSGTSDAQETPNEHD